MRDTSQDTTSPLPSITIEYENSNKKLIIYIYIYIIIVCVCVKLSAITKITIRKRLVWFLCLMAYQPL